MYIQDKLLRFFISCFLAAIMVALSIVAASIDVRCGAFDTCLASIADLSDVSAWGAVFSWVILTFYIWKYSAFAKRK